jgi:hypothetical protein
MILSCHIREEFQMFIAWLEANGREAVPPPAGKEFACSKIKEKRWRDKSVWETAASADPRNTTGR